MKQNKIEGVEIIHEGRKVFVDVRTNETAKSKLLEDESNSIKTNEKNPNEKNPTYVQNQSQPTHGYQISMNYLLAKLPNGQNNQLKLDPLDESDCNNKCQYDQVYSDTVNDQKYCTGPKLPNAPQLQRSKTMDEETFRYDNC